MLNYQQTGKARFVVGKKGGEIECVDEDGEIQWQLGVSQGVHKGKEYQDLMAPGDTLRVSPGITPMVPSGNRARPAGYGEGATETAANPDFQPTRYTESEIRMRKMVADFTAKDTAREKRIAGLENALSMKKEAEAKRRAEEEAQTPPVIEETEEVEETETDET